MQLLEGLWEIRFSVADSAELFADVVVAGCDADTAAFSRDADCDPWLVSVMSTSEPDETRLNEAIAAACAVSGLSPIAKPVIIAHPPRDWLGENRESFPAVEIGRLWIYGSHEEDPVPEGKIGIMLNAGQAFGSGTHATTKGCLLLLERYISPSCNIADIGCGSGILAIAGAKYAPASRILATDNDAVAVRVAEHNCAMNDAPSVRCGLADGYDAQCVEQAAPFDIILANILPQPLIAMAADAFRHLARDGVLIVSGLMESHQEEVIAAHEAQGLKHCDDVVIDGWVAIAFRHDGAG